MLTDAERTKIYEEERERLMARRRLSRPDRWLGWFYRPGWEAWAITLGFPLISGLAVFAATSNVNWSYMVGGLGVIYIIPASTAYNRRTAIRGAVLVVNLLAGWTFVGWVVALAMAYGRTEKEAEIR